MDALRIEGSCLSRLIPHNNIGMDAFRMEGSCLSRLIPRNNIGMDERGTFFNVTILSFAFVLCTFALVPVTSLELEPCNPGVIHFYHDLGAMFFSFCWISLAWEMDIKVHGPYVVSL